MGGITAKAKSKLFVGVFVLVKLQKCVFKYEKYHFHI